MKNKPIRMCIACRKREKQQELIRLQKEESSLIGYSGKGRSFYICRDCLEGQHIEKIVAGRIKLDIKSVEEFLRSYK